jgi:hypothetical protein
LRKSTKSASHRPIGILFDSNHSMSLNSRKLTKYKAMAEMVKEPGYFPGPLVFY